MNNNNNLPPASPTSTRHAAPSTRGQSRLLWPDWARVLALAGILWNHFVEAFAGGPIFTHPAADWPSFSDRLELVWPTTFDSFAVNLVVFVGWLGDNCVGVFILISGFGLAYSGYRSLKDFLGRRLLRIYPAFVLAHFVILLLAIMFGQLETGFDNFRTYFSLVGLRFGESLFFYVNPSWWFVWLIVQLYLVFPILWKSIERYGYAKTFAVSLAITIASRSFAALYADNVFYTYMGMFGGSRLVEFAVGAILGHAIASGRLEPESLFTTRMVMAYPAIYAIGFAFSLTWVGSTVSNLFISVGLTGIFASIGHAARYSQQTNRLITWLSARSYSFYLIHQPPLMWIATLGVQPMLQFTLSLVWYALCLPIAQAMDALIDGIQARVRTLRAQASSEVSQRA